MILYVKYNSHRKKEFQLTTTIEKENGRRFSYKKASSQNSLEFLQSLIRKYEYLNKQILPFNILKPAETKKGISFDYLESDSMDTLLSKAVRARSKSAVLEVVKEYKDLLYKITLKNEKLSEDFKNYFGGEDQRLECIDIGCMDLNLDNIFVKDGDYTLLDYEWTFSFPIPIKFIIFRAVMYSYLKYSAYNINDIWDFKQALKFLDISVEEEKLFIEFEINFQNHVCKRSINLNDYYENVYPYVGSYNKPPNVFDLYNANNNKITQLENQLMAGDAEISKLVRELTAKDQQITALTSSTWKISLENLLKDKNDAISKLNQDVAMKDQRIREMTASRFWKLRDVTVKVRNTPLHIKNVFSKSFSALKREGFFGFFGSINRQLKRTSGRFWRTPDSADAYYEWTVKKELLDIAQIKAESSDYVAFYYDWILKNEKLNLGKINEEINAFEYKPKISVIVPVFNVEAKWLNQCISSVTNQFYENWELCLYDDASTLGETLKCLRRWEAKKDTRIKISYGDKNQHISISSNNALKMATGEFIALLDNDDELTPNALFENVKLLNDQPATDMIYSDEDKVDEKGIRFDPFFKPGWTPDYFLSVMYTCHFGVYRKSIIDKIGGFRKGYEGSQDYDLVLRFIEQTSPERIGHIPKILYHWRALQSSTASSASSKDYAFEAGKNALSDYLERNSIEGVVENGVAKGLYRIRRKISGNPLVSILIPFRDLPDVLKRCLDSIEEKTTFKNYEIILINNQSREQKTIEYLMSLEKNEKIKIIDYNSQFNYSAINNTAAKKAGGDYLLLLNNDTEVIDGEWLTAMVEQIQRKEVGVVGAKLIFPNDTIQHAGVVIGIGGVFGHVYMGSKKDNLGYFGQLSTIRNYNAVTAACMMVKKDLFFEVEGLDEKNLPIALNDIDFCLKIREKGYLVVFTPFARLYHHESLSRGDDDIFAVTDPLKHQRVIEERKFFKNKWSFYILNDQYYNPNFSLGNDDKIWPSQIQSPEN